MRLVAVGIQISIARNFLRLFELETLEANCRTNSNNSQKNNNLHIKGMKIRYTH